MYLIIMLKEFIKYSNNIFPSIDSKVKEEVEKAIRDFNIDNLQWFHNGYIEGLCQGDIISEIPFKEITNEGKEKVFLAKGILLSNTCDLVRDKYIIVAPLFYYVDEYSKEQIVDLKRNVFNGKMCFTNSKLENYFIDFSRACCFNREVLEKLIKAEKVVREISLSQFGCYFLYTKLTIHFMRREDKDVFCSRMEGA